MNQRSGDTRRISVPGLAVVTIEEDPWDHFVEIELVPEYTGELVHWLPNNKYQGRVLFHGSSTQGINDPNLACFIEVLHHWDHDFDGVYDADGVIAEINDAFWRWHVRTDEFKRPAGGVYTRALMRLMPPAPVRHITFGYGELRERYQRWHYLLAIPMIILVLGLVQLQIWLLPWTRHSVISMWGLFAEKVGFIWAWLLLIMVMIVVNMRRKDHSESRSMSPNTYGFFNKAAVYAEQAFREGAENWTLAQRTTSCLLFGAIHMVNLIYPIAAILPLALGGAIFMHYYLKAYDRTKFRRTAVLESSVVHRV